MHPLAQVSRSGKIGRGTRPPSPWAVTEVKEGHQEAAASLWKGGWLLAHTGSCGEHGEEEKEEREREKGCCRRSFSLEGRWMVALPHRQSVWRREKRGRRRRRREHELPDSLEAKAVESPAVILTRDARPSDGTACQTRNRNRGTKGLYIYVPRSQGLFIYVPRSQASDGHKLTKKSQESGCSFSLPAKDGGGGGGGGGGGWMDVH